MSVTNYYFTMRSLILKFICSTNMSTCDQKQQKHTFTFVIGIDLIFRHIKFYHLYRLSYKHGIRNNASFMI